jgi:hypothetical protein
MIPSSDLAGRAALGSSCPVLLSNPGLTLTCHKLLIDKYRD